MEDGKAGRSSMEKAEEWKREHGLYMYEDMLLMKQVAPSSIPRVKAFKFAEDDILISSYPRSGTTWTQELTWLICNNADINAAKDTDLDVRSRFIEFTAPYGLEKDKPDIAFLEETDPPRVIKTHFPPQFFAVQRQEVGFKTIVVMRNLKDVIVSHYHFYKDLFDYTGTWDDFFEMFKNDIMLYGSWAKHCLKCWELRDDPNVLILKYEDIKKDPAKSILSIACFCGKKLSENQVTTIADFTFVDSMKKRAAYMDGHPNKKDFIRKGVVGGWREWFSEEQAEYVAQVLRTTTEEQGLVFNDKLV